MRITFPRPAQLRHAALALWLLSFALPTLLLKDGSTQPGYLLVVLGFASLPMAVLMLPYSAFAIASLLSNLLFIPEIWYWVRRSVAPRRPSPGMYAAILVINMLVGVRWAGAAMLPLHATGLLAQPGYYCWLLGFALLGCARAQEVPELLPWLGGLLRRVGLMALVAAATLGLGLLLIVVLQRA